MKQFSSSKTMPSHLGDQISIPCSIYRGGTSKGVLFLDSDLPTDLEKRKAILLRVMGSPDVRQIDGLGGADPLTSRIGIISKDSDGIRFQFALAHIKDPVLEFHGFCGNIISAVGPFAISQHLIKGKEPITTVPIYDVNTKMQVTAEIEVKDGIPLSKGNYRIAGVPYPGSKIALHFHHPNKEIAILPTNHTTEKLQTTFGDIEVSLIHCIDPAVFVRAHDLGLEGNEQPSQLEKNSAAIDKLEELRKLGAQKMHIPLSGFLPKIVFISPSQKDSSITARMLTLKTMHKAYAVSCGSCTAAAAFITGSLVNQMIKKPSSTITICHPQGEMEFGIQTSSQGFIEEIIVYRTARLIMKGSVYI
jgi:methylitaconate Delta-isomerase